MENLNRPAMQQVTWKDVREAVYKVNAPFAEVIDELDPGKEFTLYRAQYPFGSTIIREGVVYFPTTNGDLASIDDKRFSQKMRDELNYTGDIPVGLVLNRSTELFMKPEGSITPFVLITPGSIFALWRTLDPDWSSSYHAVTVWNMVSGSRSLFMLPKITDSNSYKKLCRARTIKLPLPRNLLDHGPIFAQMSQHKEFAYPWFSDLLFFSANWFKRRNDNAWIKFHHFLLEETWAKSQFWRNKFVFDFMWDSFVKELSKESISTKPFIADIVKHLITIALGAIPGFSPAIDDMLAPISGFQKDFIEIYGLKKYAATIFIPRVFKFNETESQPIYWSLQLPTYFESTPKPRTLSSVLENLRDIKSLLDAFIEAVINKKIVKGIIGTPIESCFNSVDFDYFHSDKDFEGKVMLAYEMPKKDATLIKSISKNNKGFSEISPFVRGCIKISSRRP